MNYYLAPLEGITRYVFRNAYHRQFRPMEKYFAPFLSPTQTPSFKHRELADVLPEHNQAYPLVPQLLTNRAEVFVWAAERLEELGYSELNLNLGCPSRTVVSRRRGSGFLADPEELEQFFCQVFDRCGSRLQISIKTRLGIGDPEEWGRLLGVYNQFPFSELIVHPRLQTDYYKGKPDWKAYRQALQECKVPLCYNGDIFTREDYRRLLEVFPETTAVMLGRGILCNPGLVEVLEGGELPENRRIEAFLEEIRTRYQELFSGERNVLFKLKELWCYLIFLFPEDKKLEKKMKKAASLAEYQMAVEELLARYEPVGRRFRMPGG